MAKKTESLEKKGLLMRFLDAIEKAGNAMPNPATLFLILTALIMIISAICANAGVSVTYETIDTANGNALVETTVKAVNLLSVDNIRVIVTKVVSNFTSFFALGTVFTIILGVSALFGKAVELLQKVAFIHKGKTADTIAFDDHGAVAVADVIQNVRLHTGNQL